LDYYSSFCGKGVDTNWDNRPITNGCHRQNGFESEDGGIYDVEFCFCEGNNCNGAQVAKFVTSLLVLGVSLFLLL